MVFIRTSPVLTGQILQKIIYKPFGTVCFTGTTAKCAQIQRVLRTGGSPEITIFIDLLARCFRPERLEELNPFTTIVGGLAL